MLMPTEVLALHKPDSAIGRTIRDARHKLGADLIIMGHHYQWDDVVEHVDRVGDSLELSRMVEDIEAQNIVFCGVHFMAETACLLARPGQKVFLPAMDAACVMAEMVPATLLESVIRQILATGRNIIPLAYVNTSLATKAVVGKYGGAVCTSANARAMMEWALGQGDGVLFLPDYKLGSNTADQLGMVPEDRHVLDIRSRGGRMNMAAVKNKTLLMWPGCCAVHASLRAANIAEVRKRYPGVRVVVHPECAPETVKAADGAGSTSYLIREAEMAPDGATLAIGTEVNLVNRLAKKHAGRVTIVPLGNVVCSNMAKVHSRNLLNTLNGIIDGTEKPMRVDSGLLDPARLSITRMLEHTAKPS